ncbi:MAG TPA: glycoside hydrolase family 15 protein [Baekduia sp.]|uniref:glycoside hydrolase family 15 protein n=1 Tax=Baekduia sp. TaxID=2600305 RepID=UPI002D78325D|nr:glycoside hydrolase family 15 protein [Baekduia sp.]HET6505433.1 glycoside hydrolase family 15 protein [Baekduia sp.]
MSVPIAEHALIGNKRTAALVAADGSIDWHCPQAFDGPSVFASLLDAERGGAFALAPVAPALVRRAYVRDTNVLRTTFETAEGTVRVTDAMALMSPSALDYNQIVRRVDGLSGRVPMRWSVHPRLRYGRRDAECRPIGDHAAAFADDGLTLSFQAFGAGPIALEGGAARGAFDCGAGDVAVFTLGSCDVGPIQLARAETLLERVDRTAEHWRRWVAPLDVAGPWRDVLVRSALALDLMVDSATCAIVAAPTLGLPERLGGDRNYDYRYAWLRDTNLTLEAMLRLGLAEQVHASLRWTFEAIEHARPRLRPMHRLDGRATLPDGELDLAGYAGSRPVLLGNRATDQLQLSTYGDIFDMVFKYVSAGNVLTGSAATTLAELADFVCLVWERPDSGIWELPEPRRFTQSTLACHLALRRALALARDGHVPDATAGRWEDARRAIERHVRTRCWSARRRAYTMAADDDRLDAAVLLSARGALPPDDERERLSSTVDAIRAELGAGGPLLHRNARLRDQEGDGAFLACSFWMAEALARCGRLEEAELTLEALFALANDVGLYGEEIDPATGAFLGNFPQALTHLALVNAVAACRDAGASSPTPTTTTEEH